MDKRTKNILIKAAIAVGILTGIYCLWCHLLSDHVIWRNIVVNGSSIYGKTKEEALETIEKDFESTWKDVSVTVRFHEKDYAIPVFPVLDIKAGDFVEAAYSLGHGKWYSRGTDRIRLMNSGNEKKEFTLTPTAEHEEKLDEVISDAGLSETGAVVQSSFEVTDTELVVTKGTSGIAPDLEKLKKEILNAISDEDYDSVIECPLYIKEPQEMDFDIVYKEIYKEASDASLDEKTKEVTPSVTGVSFSVKKAMKKYKAAKEGETFSIELILTEPEVTTEEIEALPYLDLLGSYTTYGGGTAERITNLKLAVEGINGIELKPGEIFSYNEALGPRTPERGYQIATVIVNGEREPGIGGGICQITSTLFVASLYADMDIVERHNHSRRVDYVDVGLDAAVVYGSQDFRFQNNTGYPVKITATYANGAVNVQIYGTKTDQNTVKLSVEKVDENSCKTFRSIYDESEELLETQQIAFSQYKK